MSFTKSELEYMMFNDPPAWQAHQYCKIEFGNNYTEDEYGQALMFRRLSYVKPQVDPIFAEIMRRTGRSV